MFKKTAAAGGALLLSTALLGASSLPAEAVTSPPTSTSTSTKVSTAPRASSALSLQALHALQVKQKRTSIVKTAASKKGLKYRWGGTSPKTGFDCSGFTQWVYKKHGVNLPRTTGQQARRGTVVRTRAQAQPGDLIFTNGGHHVGIVADKGAKTMWHSPRTGRSISQDPVKYYKVTKIVRLVS